MLNIHCSHCTQNCIFCIFFYAKIPCSVIKNCSKSSNIWVSTFSKYKAIDSRNISIITQEWFVVKSCPTSLESHFNVLSIDVQYILPFEGANVALKYAIMANFIKHLLKLIKWNITGKCHSGGVNLFSVIHRQKYFDISSPTNWT